MEEKKVMIHLRNGLQSRNATQFVQIASSFNSDIVIIKNERSVAAKSIMGLMSLAMRKGEELLIITDGNDEKKAISVLGDFLSNEN